MTVEQRHSTNGRVHLAPAEAEPHAAATAPRARLRGRLLVPFLLALGVVLILRRFEQDAAG